MKNAIAFALCVFMCLALVGGIVDGYISPVFSSTEEDYSDSKSVYTVSFENTDGSVLYEQAVKKGDRACCPEDPVREGFAFVGWYTSGSYSEMYNFSEPVKSSCSVYARWVDVADTTDSDGDGLTDPVEAYYGTDKNKADTDGDGLSDYVEVAILSLDPLKSDTDGNGINDGNEDFDNDTLSNVDEIALGTSPALTDTDSDGLSDSEEYLVYSTNPTVYDTDGDGASDGWEVEHGFNALRYDYSFNVTVTAENSSNSKVTASVQIVSNGEQASALKVEEVSPESHALLTEQIPGYLGAAYDFSTEGEIDSALISFSYDTSLGRVSTSFQPRIYYYNEAKGILEELPGQNVSNGKVSVRVNHFSKYILLNKVEFDKVWETEIKPPMYEGSNMVGLDIVFVIDSSGSMDWNDSSDIRLTAVKLFIDKLGEHDRAAVVDFDDSAYTYQGFTSDKNSLYNAVDRVDSSGGTNLSKGMNAAISLFTSGSYTRTDAYKYIVFLTDGDGSYSTNYTSRAYENNIIVYTIGLGSGVQANVLKGIASGTGGKYYFASTANTLPDIYDEVSFETIDYSADANSDGISDYYTKLLFEGELVLGNGSKQFAGIDFNYDKNGNLSDDYDGDGLKNSEELIVIQYGDYVYLEMRSDPTKVDSDGDGDNDPADPHPLDWDVSDRDLAMLAALCYEDGTNAMNERRFYRSDEIKGNGEGEYYYFMDFASMSEISDHWTVVNYVHVPSPVLVDNFSATTYMNGNNIVIAYRGTDELAEWIDDFVMYGLANCHSQELQARVYADTIARLYPHHRIYITGHSLGGYLAQIGTVQLIQSGKEYLIERTAYFNGIGMKFNKTQILHKNLEMTQLWDFARDGLELNGKLISYGIVGDWVHELGTQCGTKIEFYPHEKAIANHSTKREDNSNIWEWMADFSVDTLNTGLTVVISAVSSPKVVGAYIAYGESNFVNFTWMTHETDSFFASLK